MGLAEDIALIIGILAIMGALPFAMERLDRSMDQTPTTPTRRRWWRYRR